MFTGGMSTYFRFSFIYKVTSVCLVTWHAGRSIFLQPKVASAALGYLGYHTAPQYSSARLHDNVRVMLRNTM